MNNNTKITTDPNYKNNIEAVQKGEQDLADYLFQGVPIPWFRPPELNSLEHKEILKALNPQLLNKQLIASFFIGSKVGDVISATLQNDLLTTLHNTFRSRHASHLQCLLQSSGKSEKLAQTIGKQYENLIVNLEVLRGSENGT